MQSHTRVVYDTVRRILVSFYITDSSINDISYLVITSNAIHGFSEARLCGLALREFT
jgi:hypothetical protein